MQIYEPTRLAMFEHKLLMFIFQDKNAPRLTSLLRPVMIEAQVLFSCTIKILRLRQRKRRAM